MLNVVYLILLSEINLLFVILALCLLPYYMNVALIRPTYNFQTLLFFGVLILVLPISVSSGRLSLNYICMFLYLFKYSFYNDRGSISPTLVIYILTTIALIQIPFPDQVIALREVFGDNRVEVVDYSEQLLSAIRFSGIFTNPNYFAIVILTLYTIEVAKNKESFSSILNVVVLIATAASGSRAALGCYLIISLFSFYYVKSSRIYLSVFFILITLSISFIVKDLNLRFLQFQEIASNADPSVTARTEILQQYFGALLSQNDYLSLLLGQWSSNQYNYMFDGDLGNLLHLFGVFGVVTFICLNLKSYGEAKALGILLSMTPLILAGGIFGNLKTLFVFAFLPYILLHIRYRRPNFLSISNSG